MRAIEASMDGNLLFAELDADAKARVADAMTPTWIDEGSVVVEQGCETCEYYYVIEIGEARVMKNARGGEERPSLSDDSARRACASTVTRWPTSLEAITLANAR